MNKSLDPRVNRLNLPHGELTPKAPLDQFGTFEVFVQLKEGKGYQHEGSVHAPNLDMAFLFAKEQFSRRLMCSGIFVAETRNVFVTGFTENKDSVYVNLLIKKCLRESTLHLGYSQHSKSPYRCANIWKQRF